MDLSFSPRQGTPVAAPPRARFAILVATLAGAQAALPTAAAALRLRRVSAYGGDATAALATLFTGGGDWRAAAIRLGGSFHPRLAAAASGNARSTLVKAGFTFAF